MSFPQYAKYVDSGVDWIGQVPSHWKLLRARFVGTFTASGIDKKYDASEIPVKMFNYLDVYNSKTKILNFSESLMETTTTLEKILEHSLIGGDVLFTPSSETADDIGHAAVVDVVPASVVYSYHLIRFRCNYLVCTDFLKFYFNSKIVRAYFESVCTGTTRMVLAREDFKNTWLILPTYEEQCFIANFLKIETSKIDALITEQENLIDLLKEKRQILISNVVTKGVDPNVKMKHSGIEWLGEIPQHWELTRLGWITSAINDINHEMPESTSEGVPFLSAKDLDDDGNLYFSDVKKISENDFNRLSKKICPQIGDIIYSRIGTIGRAAVVKTDERFLVSYSCCVIRPNKNRVIVDYLRDILSSDLILTESKARIRSMGQPDLGLGEIKRFPIPLPPIEEQIYLDRFLKKEVQKNNDILNAATEVRDVLLERRSALILAAVTGQIDVCRETT